jgi:hypothetical protein
MKEKTNRFLIKVLFGNNDTYEQSSQLYLKSKIPDKEWLRSLYDGVHTPEKMLVMGTVISRSFTGVVCHGNIIDTIDPNEGGVPESDGRRHEQGNCPKCGRTLSLEIMKDGEEDL